ncbi:hypothetical protein GCM10010392_33000 [Streptomyces clavifer]|nr:hypothetical protein GCM10010392_33000 [Streptomyces clavifer]
MSGVDALGPRAHRFLADGSGRRVSAVGRAERHSQPGSSRVDSEDERPPRRGIHEGRPGEGRRVLPGERCGHGPLRGGFLRDLMDRSGRKGE